MKILKIQPILLRLCSYLFLTSLIGAIGLTQLNGINPIIHSARAQSQAPRQVYMPIVRNGASWVNPIGVETNVHIDPSASIYPYLDTLNPGYVRMNRRISWRQLQPYPNQAPDWNQLSDLEAELQTLGNLGARPILIVDDYPLWATTLPISCSAIKPEYYDEFAAFVGELVTRYGTWVKDWELGNEVDVDPHLIDPNSVYGCWGDISDLEYYGGRAYGEMIKVVSPVIKSIDPAARVWHAGMFLKHPETLNPAYGKPENFLRGVLTAGAGPYIDVLAIHAHSLYYGGVRDPYISPANPWTPWGGGMRGKANFARSIMAEYGVDKPIMINEITIGCINTDPYCDPPGPEFYAFQADMSIRQAVRAVSKDLMGIIWYTLEGPGWRSGGLLNGQDQPKPTFQALLTLSQAIKNTTYIDAENYSSTSLEGYRFERSDGKLVDVIWAVNDTSERIRVPKARFIRALDRTGNAVTPLDAGADYQLPVGFSPILVESLP
ncbi:MAG: hypothetical protein ACK2UW_18445 [Anaerolineales bacterium]